jgi:hypothetical protein
MESNCLNLKEGDYMLPLLPIPPSEIEDKASGWRRWLLGAFVFLSIITMVLEVAVYFANGCQYKLGTFPPAISKTKN